jgi:alkylation response protein AidB-like acyl-CoA dehydrogenase
MVARVPTSCIPSSRWKNSARAGASGHWLQPAQRDRGAVHPALRHRSTKEEVPAQDWHSGEMVGAIAMSEPAAGSDLQGVKTSAIQQPDGSYLLNGSKTFITNGWHADLVIVVAKTNPAAGAKGTSLLLVERGMPGFEKGKRLKKLGLKAQDTSELFFDNVRVPADHLLGGEAYENRGFICLMEQLPWERLQIAITAVASAQAAIDWTVAYVKERKVFGQPWRLSRTPASRWPNCRQKCRWHACLSINAPNW